ncbi:MAG: AraC family transcriptional regulator [Gammaproteobacteria bacterium CG_4_10_14_0_8_um_filter_38_16]|nr:MAG: AraC family transcriptional regulator [Gammaproteobacteria bacterium CG_4_10_14_0_8_um_filter_38_16]PJA02629.1 MAG: AraC family transcriptional regulator [Gammaproteobacteria bacterium CG_4_10_14_0_2_um_filter_38_22]PJB11085.1 MAG: AraC family transcriptional regulator [Gammaproteobacteria bacterium CG_4_9_14_3_um_filter_38_9]
MTTHAEQNYQERILKVLVYIQNNLDQTLSLEALAETAHFSPFHFHRIFTAHTGESIKSYIRRLRLERATRDLSLTDLPIIQISERAGYETQQSFHRAFKEAFNITPKEFRDKAGNEITAFQHEEKLAKRHQPIVEVKIIEPIKVAFARHTGSYKDVFQSWFKLVGEVGMNHLLSEKTLKISIPHDAPETTPEDKIRYDACVTIDELKSFKPKGQVGIQTLRGGKYAVITHHGPLDTIESTYQILFAIWLPQSGYEPADFPNFMLHRKMPFVTPDKIVETDIYLPLK